MDKKRSVGVPFILVTLLLDTLGIGVIIPVLPRLIGSFLEGDLDRASSYYGAFVAVYAAMQFVFAPILGGLSDRFGRRPVLLISIAGSVVSSALLGIAGSVAMVFASRAMAGMSKANLATANA